MKPADDPRLDYRLLVERGYDSCASHFESIRAREVEPVVELLIDTLMPNSEVLDLGCGPGVPIASALARHFNVTGVDISEAMISLARQNVPGANFHHADMMKVELPPEGYDVVLSFYAVFHLPKESHKALFQRMHSWLKPGGFLLVTVASEDEAPYTEKFLGVPMYWSNYGLPTYLAILHEIGFEIVKVTSVGHGYEPLEETEEENHPLIYARKLPSQA